MPAVFVLSDGLWDSQTAPLLCWKIHFPFSNIPEREQHLGLVLCMHRGAWLGFGIFSGTLTDGFEWGGQVASQKKKGKSQPSEAGMQLPGARRASQHSLLLAV